MKESKRVYKGIEFVCVDQLPVAQQLLLQHTENPERIKILIDNAVLSNCIEYSHYSDWFTKVYKHSVATQEQLKPVEKAYLPEVEIALTKI